ncbi:hypothetical protein F383_29778 [Gossypium arboreum]|uniref:Uncharacterized protein n=2 Tax=Gossypium arboreum TaxID=29729 RepID=A0A0B0PDM6_GOSAR|nr:hypothetical protein F383_29778 [Gossypium arboreum]
MATMDELHSAKLLWLI